MKKLLLIGALYVASVSSVFGQSVSQQETPTACFTNQTLTTSYIAGSTSVDLKSYDSVAIIVDITAAGVTGNIQAKYQWSLDNSTWVDEMALTAGTTASGETPYVPYTRRLDIPLTSTTGDYVERVRRLARYFRVAAKSSTATTATAAIKAVPMNNQN